MRSNGQSNGRRRHRDGRRITATADRRRVQIERIVPPNERTTPGTDRRVIDVPSDLFASAPVRGGDVMHVLEVAKRVANRITVNGNVWTPGPVGFTPGMSCTTRCVAPAGSNQTAISATCRSRGCSPDSTRAMLRTAVFDTTGRPVDNFDAAPTRDEITYSQRPNSGRSGTSRSPAQCGSPGRSRTATA